MFNQSRKVKINPLTFHRALSYSRPPSTLPVLGTLVVSFLAHVAFSLKETRVHTRRMNTLTQQFQHLKRQFKTQQCEEAIETLEKVAKSKLSR